METKVNELAALMHEAWRQQKIKIGWHLPENCPEIKLLPKEWDISMKPLICKDCHPCVNTWDKLTDKEKELALQNARIAVEFSNQPKPGNTFKTAEKYFDLAVEKIGKTSRNAFTPLIEEMVKLVISDCGNKPGNTIEAAMQFFKKNTGYTVQAHEGEWKMMVDYANTIDPVPELIAKIETLESALALANMTISKLQQVNVVTKTTTE